MIWIDKTSFFGEVGHRSWIDVFIKAKCVGAFTIKGKLDGLNKYINMNRTNRFAGNSEKQKNQRKVYNSISIEDYETKDIEYPLIVSIVFYEKDKRRDVDNITSAQKFILDAIVQKGMIPDDSRKYVYQVIPIVLVDKENPRIEVRMWEAGVIENE